MAEPTEQPVLPQMHPCPGCGLRWFESEGRFCQDCAFAGKSKEGRMRDSNLQRLQTGVRREIDLSTIRIAQPNITKAELVREKEIKTHNEQILQLLEEISRLRNYPRPAVPA